MEFCEIDIYLISWVFFWPGFLKIFFPTVDFFVNFQFHEIFFQIFYFSGIFQLIFGRLTTSKTTKFIKSFLVFLSLFTYNFGGTTLQEMCDAIQPNLFGMVLERLIILEVQKVSGAKDRKICAVGMTKLLCETPSLLNGAYSQYWPRY